MCRFKQIPFLKLCKWTPFCLQLIQQDIPLEILASLRNGAGLLTPAGLWKERTHSSPGWRPQGQELERVHLLHRATNRPTLCQSWIKASHPSRLWLNFLSCFYLSGLWPTHSPHLLFTCLISSSPIFSFIHFNHRHSGLHLGPIHLLGLYPLQLLNHPTSWVFTPVSLLPDKYIHTHMGFPGGTVAKNLPANAGDTIDSGLIPGSGRSPRVGNGNPLQFSCLENSLDRGAWLATVHGVTKSQTRLSDWIHTHTQIHIHMYICIYTHIHIRIYINIYMNHFSVHLKTIL